MLTHLGRHNLEQHGGMVSVDYLRTQHGVAPQNLTAWLSPAAGGENYPLYAFSGRSLHDVAIEQLTRAGVQESAIDGLFVDTTGSDEYFSHSEFLKGRRETDGRFTVCAVMTA